MGVFTQPERKKCDKCGRLAVVTIGHGMASLCLEHYGRRFWPATTGYQVVKM